MGSAAHQPGTVITGYRSHLPNRIREHARRFCTVKRGAGFSEYLVALALKHLGDVMDAPGESKKIIERASETLKKAAELHNQFAR